MVDFPAFSAPLDIATPASGKDEGLYAEGNAGGYFKLPFAGGAFGVGLLLDARLVFPENTRDSYLPGFQFNFESSPEQYQVQEDVSHFRYMLDYGQIKKSPIFLSGRGRITLLGESHTVRAIGLGSSAGQTTLELASDSSYALLPFPGESIGVGISGYFGNTCAFPLGAKNNENDVERLSLRLGASLKVTGLDQQTTPPPEGVSTAEIITVLFAGAHRLGQNFCSANAISSQAIVVQNYFNQYGGGFAGGASLPPSAAEGQASLQLLATMSGAGIRSDQIRIGLQTHGSQEWLFIGGGIVLGLGHLGLSLADESPSTFAQTISHLSGFADHFIGKGLDLDLSTRRDLEGEQKKDQAFDFFLTRFGMKSAIYLLGWLLDETWGGQALLQGGTQELLSVAASPDPLETRMVPQSSHLLAAEINPLEGDILWGYQKRNYFGVVHSQMRLTAQALPAGPQIADPLTGREAAREPALAKASSGIGISLNEDYLHLGVGANLLLQWGGSQNPRGGIGLEEHLLVSLPIGKKTRFEFGASLLEEFVGEKFNLSIVPTAGFSF